MGKTLVPAILTRYMAKQGPKRPKTAFWAISESGGSKLVEQSGTRMEQVRAHPRPGDALKPFLWSGRALWVCQRAAKQGPKQPKTAFFGHKRIWWFQTGGTVWNKGGTSQGTSLVMHWNRFGGQGGPSGCEGGVELCLRGDEESQPCQRECASHELRALHKNCVSVKKMTIIRYACSSASHSSPLHVLLFVMDLGGNVNVDTQCWHLPKCYPLW